MGTRWPSSTSRASTSATTRRCSAACTTWPSRSRPSAGPHLKAKLDGAGIAYQHIDGTSIYFRDPDGARLELIADPLGEMYGHQVM